MKEIIFFTLGVLSTKSTILINLCYRIRLRVFMKRNRFKGVNMMSKQVGERYKSFSGLYMWVLEGVPVYVGQSTNVAQRNLKHRREFKKVKYYSHSKKYKLDPHKFDVLAFRIKGGREKRIKIESLFYKMYKDTLLNFHDPIEELK